jgi:hypothetical protein
MSSESSRSRALIDRAASGLEHGLARVIAQLRAEWATEMRALAAEKHATLIELQVYRDQIAEMKADFRRWFEEISKQKIELRGLPGERGDKGEPGAAGTAGEAGRDGRDGLPGIPGVNGRDGIDGKPGLNGKDGLGVDDLDVMYDGERSISLKWSVGDREIVRSFNLPIPIYRGPYENGRAYLQGDAVTYGGSMFIAKRATMIKPESDDWQLATKKGLPGSNGKPGERGPPGPAGRDGRDLTQMTFEGRKY